MTDFIKNSQSAEDYLESLLLISNEQGFAHRIEIAKKMCVSQAAVNKAIKILLDKGYVTEVGKHLYLTDLGKAEATAIFEKHCIIRKFLLSLGVSEQTAEDDACKMEHLISNETFELIKKQVENN